MYLIITLFVIFNSIMSPKKLMRGGIFVVVMGVLTATPLFMPSQVQALTNKEQERCNLVTSRIELLTTRYGNNKQRHVNAYINAKDRITNLVNKLESKGYDVSKLKADLIVWEEKTQKFGTDYQEFINILNESKTYICGQSNGDFLASLAKARQQLLIIRQDVLDIRLYYQETIRADIQALKSQKGSN
jgi:hypothetical protein